jgi:HEAT repeat protein
MDSSEYRRQYTVQLNRQTESQPGYHEFLNKSNSLSQRLEALAGSTKSPTEEDLNNAINIIRDQEEEPELRASALRAIGRDIGNREESIDLLLELLKDKAEPREVRLAALQVLQMLAFISPLFMSKRPEFLAALRSIVEDPDTAVRQAAIEVLAMEKDEYVQRRLNAGLDDPSKALVSPEKAIQLLGQDVHAELYPRLREIIQNPPSPAAREEAVRLLAGDPESKELLVNLLRDKDEDLKIRTLGAVALQSVDPVKFTEQAKQIVLDNSEDENLRLTGLTGLTHFGDQPSLIPDREFIEGLERLRKESTSDQLKEAVDRYLNRTK